MLEWLQKYTFVEEQKFADPAHADVVARFFLDELFRQGTTTAMVYCTVRPESAEAFYKAMLQLHPNRVNPGALWGAAITLFPPA